MDHSLRRRGGRDTRQRAVTLLTTYLGGLRWHVLGLALLLFGGIAMQLTAPQIRRRFLDTATSAAPLERLYVLAALFIGASLLAQCSRWGRPT